MEDRAFSAADGEMKKRLAKMEKMLARSSDVKYNSLDRKVGTAAQRAAQAKLRELGVSGIPTLLLGGEWQLPSGALHADDIVPALRMVEERGGATGSFFAETLGISDAVMEETLQFAP